LSARLDGGAVRDLGCLLRSGGVVGLGDGLLLECFASGEGSSELAFAALIERHGAMVLRACRTVLRDEHDAQDAFQVTFLALSRRAGSLSVRDSVGPWLHRVALRAAARARRASGRRREVERRAAVLVSGSASTPAPAADGLEAVVHEEVNRLPERFRVPVVLCDLEGRSLDEAARQLGCPVGTIKSRLARARDRLRGRLARRGLAPSAVGVGPIATWAGFESISMTAGVPRALVGLTTGAALRSSTASPAVIALTREVLRSMTLIHWRWAWSLLLAPAAALAGLAAVGGPPTRQGPAPSPPAAASPTMEVAQAPKPQAPAETLSWRRVDRYEPPDFDRFFPDDPEGAARLKALWDAPDKDKRADEEVLRTARLGLRRAPDRLKDEVIRWLGGKYVWGKSPQDPEAIEIMYHASGYAGTAGMYNKTRHYAVYFGLSTVQPKTPAILHALADLCLRVDDPNDLDRVAWGVRSQQAEILAFVTPHLASADPAEREKAGLVAKILKGEVRAFEWAARRAEEQMRAKFEVRLPEIKEALGSDDVGRAREALRLTLREGLPTIMDGSFIPLLGQFADDPDSAIRRDLARAIGGRWIWRADKREPAAIALALRLGRDPDFQVRYDALYYGLSRIRGKKGEEIVRVLLDFGLSFGFLDMRQMIVQGLDEDRDVAAKVLDEALCGGDRKRVEAARAAYRDLTGKEPPPVGDVPTPPAGTHAGAFRDLYDHLARAYPNFALKGIDWPKVGEELMPLAARASTDDEFGLLVERLVARLEDSHAVVMPGSARPPTPNLPQWDPGVACLIDDHGRPVVFDVARGSPAERAGIKAGQAVVSVDGVPAAELVDAWMGRTKAYFGYSSERTLRHDAARAFLQQARRGARLTLVLEDPDGRRATVSASADLGPRYVPRLPVSRPGVLDSVDVSWARLDGEIGYLYIRRIPDGLEAKLDAALRALGGVKGLVLDVRGNSGGGFDQVTAFANFDAAPEAAPGADRPHFAGPIALLVDARTISAGEGWASWFVARKRARLFGSTTAGASCRKETYTLTNGLYRVVVPVKAYTGSLDRPIERRGLEPDVEIRCSAADLARGRDTVVEAAASWLGEGGRH
jgi:RNA polymerase sigma factor (sigma-70 family)